MIDPHKHRYFRKLMRLRRRGRIRTDLGMLVDIDVKHDDWCPVFDRPPGYCTCNCQIVITYEDGTRQVFN